MELCKKLQVTIALKTYFWSLRMKNTINLAIIYFKQTLAQLFSSKKRVKVLSNGALAFVIFIVVMLSMAFAYLGTAEQFNEIGHPEYVLVIGLMLSAFLVLMMTIYDSQNQYYKNKDYDMLSSMPIKTWSIITAKYLSSYFVSFFYGFIIAFPAYVVYFIYCPITIPAIVYSIFSFFFIPTFNQLVGSIIAYLISLITFKMTNKKIFTNILTIVFTIALVTFIYFANSTLMQNLFIDGFSLWIKIVLPHVFFLFNSVTTGSFLQFLAFLAITLGFALISISIITLGYKNINSSLITSKRKKSNKPLTYLSDKTFSSLIKKETRTFFNSPSYFINGLMGPIIVVILAVTMSLGAKDVYGSFENFPSEYFITMYICFSSMCLGIGVPTSASITIEGRKFYVLKSLPISYNLFIISKLAFNIFLSLPFVLIGSTIFVIIAPCSIGEIFLIYLIPLLSMLTFSGLGLLTNLKWQRLDWTNEAQAVKQSLSLFVSMMTAIFLSMIPFLIYFLLFNEISSILSLSEYFAIYLAFITLFCAIVYILLFTHGKKLYRKI